MKTKIFIVNLIIAIIIGILIFYFASEVISKIFDKKGYFLILIGITVLILIFPLIKKGIKKK